ncbi:MAG: DUF3179 domain-containing protein [Acidimicrobiia bacterium]|nr:DUF3179 domain-containing protein [Acidimicrobiia bacterium]
MSPARAIPVVAILAAASVSAQLDDRVYVVLPRDAIPAIDNPTFEPAASAAALADEEIVLGLVGEREQRAYSTWQLDRHEIVNDIFEGTPIAVTWCPLCGTGIVYERALDGRLLSFGVSGMLYRDGLVMYDRQTDSLWTHVDGLAIRGPLAGRRLQLVPALHATWKQWRTLYPDSTVMRKRGEFRTPYESYNRNPSEIGILGRRNPDARLPPKERILGVRAGDSEMAFPLAAVRDARLVQARVGDQPVVVVAPGRNLPVIVFDRRVDGTPLDFTLAETADHQPVLRDTASGTTWSLADGRGLEGPKAETRLLRATTLPAFWFGWRSYFPRTGLWLPDPDGRP